MNTQQLCLFIHQQALRFALWSGLVVCVRRPAQRPAPGANWGLSLQQVEQIVDVYMGNRGGLVYVPSRLDALPRLAANVFTDLTEPGPASHWSKPPSPT